MELRGLWKMEGIGYIDSKFTRPKRPGRSNPPKWGNFSMRFAPQWKTKITRNSKNNKR
jgi:hypothetical protein